MLFGPTPPTSRKTPGVAAIFEFRGRRGRAVTPGAGRRGSLIRTIRPVCQATKADGAVGGLVPKLIPPSRKNTWGSCYFAISWTLWTPLCTQIFENGFYGTTVTAKNDNEIERPSRPRTNRHPTR